MQRFAALTGQSEFQKIAQDIGRFAAVNYVASEARKRSDKLGNHILHSQAITWVLTNEAPKSPRPKPIHKSRLHDILCEVDDKDVLKCVIWSLRRSKRSPQYIYLKHMTANQRARVRVLVRMIFYSK